jgi:hypothetical protein
MKLTSVIDVRLDANIRRVLHQTATALGVAGLDGAAAEVADRLTCSTGLVEVAGVEGGRAAATVEVRLAPYAELALLEVERIARSAGSVADRTARIRSVLLMAGF